MARTDNLKVFLTDVADAIRTKKGTTELIPANTFDTEIESISGGKEEQSKSVTITKNGTQTVTPDENKTLSSVEITTNVPQKTEQTKSVTITQNRTQTVTPDAGKVLSSVEITTNVPQKPEQSKSVTITQNGRSTVTPDAGKVLSSVEIGVNIPVKSEQEKNINITQDGSYSIVPDEGKTLSKVGVNVNTGSISSIVEEKDINFRDYDGTLLESWTLEELQSKTDLPSLPSHPGLITQGWNWTLEGLKEWNDYQNVGINYITDDGYTRIYITLKAPNLTPQLGIGQQYRNGYSIDWGDGSAIEASGSGTGTSSIPKKTHTYESEGDYIIKIIPAASNKGLIYLVGSTYATWILNSNNLGTSQYPNVDTRYASTVTKIELGERISTSGHAFSGMPNLKSITVPTDIQGSGFVYAQNTGLSFFMPSSMHLDNYYCGADNSKIEYISLPEGITKLNINSNFRGTPLRKVVLPAVANSGSNYLFERCSNLISCSFKGGKEDIADYIIDNCYSLTKFVYPPSTASSPRISGFRYLYSLSVADFRNYSGVPTLLDSSPFPTFVNKITFVVPDDLYESWIAANKWSQVKSRIMKVSDYDAL